MEEAIRRDRETLFDKAAKCAFCLLGLHGAAFVLCLRQEPASPRLVVLLLYAICILRLDYIQFHLKSPGALRFLRRYWALATVCMGLWLVWGERWLISSGDIMKILFSHALVPYCSVFLVNDQGSSAFLSQWGTAALLALCAAHCAYYVWLSWKGEDPHGPVDL